MAEPAGSGADAGVDQRLATARDAAAARLDDAEASLVAAAERADPTGRDDEHDPDGATAAFEQALAAGRRDQARRHLAELDRAIDRLRSGVYGRCESCGTTIDPERLRVEPAARECVPCAGSTGAGLRRR